MMSYKFQVNQMVYSKKDGQSGRIVKHRKDAPHYVVELWNNSRVFLDERDLELTISSRPSLIDQLVNGDLGYSSDFDLLTQSTALLFAYHYEGLSYLSNSRLAPKPYQIFVAHRVLQELYPRFLLADEVGLGKTIEAGLILKELTARGLAERILIITPTSLCHQWQSELKIKFNEDFYHYTGNVIKENSNTPRHKGRNPWEIDNKIIVSLQLALRHTSHGKDKTNRWIDEVDWDLVIFDEAHHLRRYFQGKEIKTTKSYDLAQDLANKTKALLLLTATPLQTSQYDAYSLIELLNHNLFFSYDHFQELQQYHHHTVRNISQETEFSYKLSQVMIRNRKSEVLANEHIKRKAFKVNVKLTLEELELYNEVSNYIRVTYSRVVSNHATAIGFVLTIFRKLLVSSPHALAAALENRANKLEEALENWKKQVLQENDLEEIEENLEYYDQPEERLNAPLFLLTGSDSPKETKDEIKKLRYFAEKARLLKIDSKAIKLLDEVEDLLETDPSEKIIIFTQFRKTQNYLQELFEQRGYQVALFHGHSKDNQHNYDKIHEFKRFKTNTDVRIMISTEVGGEGLNFQFCRVIFNYDLPWNPMRIEQRIGRLDRIGQKYNVHIYNFFLEGTLDARILEVLQDRVRIFEETIGSLDPILGENIENTIRDIMLKDKTNESQQIRNFEAHAKNRLNELHKAEEKMADFVMDRNSFRPDIVDKILKQQPPIRNEDMEALTQRFLSRYPQDDVIRLESSNIYNINTPHNFRKQCREKYNIHLAHSYRCTFDPQTAIEDDTIDHFLAFGQPFFDAIIRYCTDEQIIPGLDGKVVIRVIHNADYIGYEGIQFNYVLTFEGSRIYKKLISIVIDKDGNYNKKLSAIICSSFSDNHNETNTINWPINFLKSAEDKSKEIIDEIAELEMEKFVKQNEQDYPKNQKEMTRLFDFRLRYEREKLKQRQEQLRDAQQKKQRIVHAFEGQVRATEGRIRELENESKAELEKLKYTQSKLSIDLLNLAHVKILR